MTLPKREILFEIKKIGFIYRIAAIDPMTGDEAVIQAPVSASLEEAKSIAARKLDFIMAKKSK